MRSRLIRRLVSDTAWVGLEASSATRMSTCLPRMPPAALISATAMRVAVSPVRPLAAEGPVIENSVPRRMRSSDCAAWAVAWTANRPSQRAVNKGATSCRQPLASVGRPLLFLLLSMRSPVPFRCDVAGPCRCSTRRRETLSPGRKEYLVRLA
ncbi:hypothetical protein D9M69_527610 [compost metagenome]